MDSNDIRSVVFDFDGTLCSGRYFHPLGQDALDTIERLVFGANSRVWADPWMRGELTARDVAAYLSEHLGASPDEIVSALREGCSHMPFNPAVYAFARQMASSGRKTALVTANMDVFTEVVVPAHGLDGLFDIILNTADCGTLDKAVLWRQAFRAMGEGYDFASALLIEDNARMVAQFESLGGWACRYEDDGAFRVWLEDAGFEAAPQN